MRRQNQRSASIIIPLILIGGLIGVGFTQREAILRFMTGQDIIEDLLADLGGLPTPSPFPTLPGGTPGTAPTPGIFPGGEVPLAPDGFPVQPRRHVLKYTVQEGDALFPIAEKFGIHPNTIFWANTDTLQDNINLLYVGIELYILPVNGVYHQSDGMLTIAEIAAQYGVAPGDILYSEFNQLAESTSDSVPPAGLHMVVPGGRREYISWRAPIHTGTESGNANPEGDIHPGSCRALYNGTGGLGEYINPLGAASYRVTNGFAPWHPGVDLAADYATPIYASETGVVVFAGWHRRGYGELIILDHGDGWTTYYAHLATRFVGCGDQGSKGQLIAEMGASGDATGVHLHFELRSADSAQNPADFIPLQDTRNSR